MLGLSAIAARWRCSRFFIRQRRAENPLYDLNVAGRRVFWVAACAGIIVFGSLMAAMFVSQQYLQNVLGYSTLEAGRGDPPGGAGHGASSRHARPSSSRRAGPRFTLLCGYVFLFLAFVWMLLLWNEGDAVLADRGRVRLHRRRRRPGGNARIALAHRLGARDARRHGLRHGRSSARSRRRDHAVDLRRAPDGRVCVGDGGADRGVGQGRHASTQAALTKSFDERGGRRAATPAVRGRDHRRRRSRRSSTATTGHTRPAWSRSLLGAVLVFFMFPKHERGEATPRFVPRAGHRSRRAVTWSVAFRLRRYLRESLWVVPLVGGVLGWVFGLASSDLGAVVDLGTRWQYSATTAESVLAAVVAASVGLVGFVVTVSVLIVQMATGTFSARYMRIFYRDWAFKAVLARARSARSRSRTRSCATSSETTSRTSASRSPARSSGSGSSSSSSSSTARSTGCGRSRSRRSSPRPDRRALREVLAEAARADAPAVVPGPVQHAAASRRSSSG